MPRLTRRLADLLGHRQISTTERYINGLGSAGHRNATRATATILSMARKETPAPITVAKGGRGRPGAQKKQKAG